MSNLDKLVSLGAYSCGGDLIFNGKVLGILRHGDFFPNEAGQALLAQDIEDAVVVKETRRKPKAVAAEPAPEDIQIDV